jgi:hypothetical protein
MLKKSLIFGSVALFLAALTLTGCPTDAENDSSAGAYRHSVYGSNVDPYQVQDVIDKAIAAGEAVYFQNGLTINDQNGAHINFKTAKVIFAGTVYGSSSRVGSYPPKLVINAVDAEVDFSNGSLAYVKHYIFKDKAPSETQVPVDSLVEFKNNLSDMQPTATVAAVQKFKLGALVNHDYSTSTGGINTRITAKGLESLYVIEELTIPTDGAVPGVGIEGNPLTITALGTIDLLDTPTQPVFENRGVGVGPGILLGTSSNLISSKGNVTVTLPPTSPIPNITVESGKTIKIRGVTAFNIKGRLKGAGTLEVESVPTGDIIIGSLLLGGGDGNVHFTGTVSGVTSVNIQSTGKTTFDNPLSGINKDSLIAGDVEFLGGLTVTTKDITLAGNVTLKNSAFDGSADYAISLTNTELSLGPNKTISIGGGRYSGTGATVPLTPVLSAGPLGVVIKAGSNEAVLTAAPPLSTSASTNEDAAKRNANNKLTLTDGDITINVGVLEVVKDATFEIKDAAVITKLETNDAKIGFLAVADGGKISLTGAGNIGTSPEIKIGDTVISYAGADTIAVLAGSGGSITLGSNTIEGVEGATLALKGNGADIELKDNVGAPPVGAKSLTLKGINLDLTDKGSLTITGQTSVNKLILTNKAKLTLYTGEGAAPAPEAELSQIGTSSNERYGAISGDAVLIIPATNTSKTPRVISLAHGGGPSVDITGLTGPDIFLSKSTQFSKK